MPINGWGRNGHRQKLKRFPKAFQYFGQNFEELKFVSRDLELYFDLLLKEQWAQKNWLRLEWFLQW